MEKMNFYDLRDELLDAAAQEAEKSPNITKEELKTKLYEHLLESELLQKLLPGDTAEVIKKIIGAVTDMAVRSAGIYLKLTGDAPKAGRKKAAAIKTAPKKRRRRKKAAKVVAKAVKKAAPKKKAVKKVAKKAAKKKAPAKKKAAAPAAEPNMP